MSTDDQEAGEAETATSNRVVNALQRMGFSPDETRMLLEGGAGRGHGFSEVARAKLADVESELADLKIVRQALLDATAGRTRRWGQPEG
ncbi:hypothetical protein [Lentzea cavernae]|uniref:hypothetical protein n=1 Tax=Lentzea cavernae TaxID=2020703 RepID=UPI00174C8815|nr:hypothetical protein [Lentzea cavernae]